MTEKGRAFVGSAMLLRQQGRNEFVALHLLCQGIEILGKGYLLSQNYDFYNPRLARKYGHNLLKLIRKVESLSGLQLRKGEAYTQLQLLDTLYAQHNLRYGSAMDVLVDPATIRSDALTRRLAAVLRYADRFNSAV